jgi:predicted GH43/DUF377 family glycosyl hydrolase
MLRNKRIFQRKLLAALVLPLMATSIHAAVEFSNNRLSEVKGTSMTQPDWAIGPFTRPKNAQPVITPNPASVFDCPMRKEPVHWEATHTFNPAAVVRDGKVYLLYRAEDDHGKGIGGYTSRLGLAVSADGIHFRRMPAPVLFPAEDDQKGREWEGGCEDPRCVELEDGSYALFYTQYYRMPGIPRQVDLGVARSKDLIHWTKTGPVTAVDTAGKSITPRKSASLVCELQNGRLIATKIKGRYWLYYGEGTIHLMSSPDLKQWRPEPAVALPPRKGKFDSGLAECGPPALLTPKGIVLLYNGKNANNGSADPALKQGVYANGQALFDARDPTKLLSRPDQPFFKPELSWEATGQYAAGTTFIEGLVAFEGKWMLYYGCADSFVGVALADINPGGK